VTCLCNYLLAQFYDDMKIRENWHAGGVFFLLCVMEVQEREKDCRDF